MLCRLILNPHFLQGFYCGGGSVHIYCVARLRAPRHTVEYACGALGRAFCIHARLRRLATKPCEQCGLRATGRSRLQGADSACKPLTSRGLERVLDFKQGIVLRIRREAGLQRVAAQGRGIGVAIGRQVYQNRLAQFRL